MTEGKLYSLFKSVLSHAKLNQNVTLWINNGGEVNAWAQGSLPGLAHVTVTKGVLNLKLPNIIMKSLFAHEIGHLKLRHMGRRTFHKNVATAALSTAHDCINFNTTAFLLNEKVKAVPKRKSKYAIVRYFQSILPTMKKAYTWKDFSSYLLIMGAIEIIANLWLLCVSRTHEYQADEFAGRLYGPKNNILLAQALKGIPIWFVRLQLALGVTVGNFMFEDEGWLSSLKSTHPSLKARVKRDEELLKEMRNKKSLTK